MQDTILQGLTVMFVLGISTSWLVHWLYVCRQLYRHGSRFPTGFLPWRLFREMEMYKEVCLSRSDSLSRYYILLLGWLFNIGLGVILAAWWLWRLNNPLP